MIKTDENGFFTLKSVPAGTIVILESGYKAMVFETEKPESLDREKHLMFMETTPLMMWDDNVGKEFFRIKEVLGKFKGGFSEM